MAVTSTVSEASGLQTNVPPSFANPQDPTTTSSSTEPTRPGVSQRPTLVADAGVLSGPAAGLTVVAAAILIAAYVAWVSAPQEDRDAIVGGAVDKIIGAAESINARFLVPARDQLMQQVHSLFENIQQAGSSLAEADRVVKNWVSNLFSGRSTTSTPVPMTPSGGVPLPSTQSVTPPQPLPSNILSGGATGAVGDAPLTSPPISRPNVGLPTAKPPVDPAVQRAQATFTQGLSDAQTANTQINALRSKPAGSDGQLQSGAAQFYWDITGGGAGLQRTHATLRTLESRIAEARRVYADANAPLSELKAAYARLTGAVTSPGGYGLAPEATDSWMNVGRWSNDAEWWRTQLNQTANAFSSWVSTAWEYVSDATHRPQQAALPSPPLGANAGVYEAWQAAMSYLSGRPATTPLPATADLPSSTTTAQPRLELVNQFPASVQSVADVWVNPDTGAVSTSERPAGEGWIYMQIGRNLPPGNGESNANPETHLHQHFWTVMPGGPGGGGGNKALLILTAVLGTIGAGLSWRALDESSRARENSEEALRLTQESLQTARQNATEPPVWLSPLPPAQFPANASYADKADAYIASWRHFLDPQVDPRTNLPRGAAHQALLNLPADVGVQPTHRAQFTQSATAFLAELNQTASRLRASRDPAEQKALFESMLNARPPVGRFGADNGQPQKALDSTMAQMNTAMQNRALQLVNWPGAGQSDAQLQRAAQSLLPPQVASALQPPAVTTPGQPPAETPGQTQAQLQAQQQAQRQAQEAAAYVADTRNRFNTEAGEIAQALRVAVLPGSPYANSLANLTAGGNALPTLPMNPLTIGDVISAEQMNDPAALRAASQRLNTLWVALRSPVSDLNALRAGAEAETKAGGRFSTSEALRTVVNEMTAYNTSLSNLRTEISAINRALLARAAELEKPAASPQ
jgi:hypothetical protein